MSKTRDCFMQTDRIGFSTWKKSDCELALRLWSDPLVTKYISASNGFSREEIYERLTVEVESQKSSGIQYWPVFERQSLSFVGCCGLRLRYKDIYELGFHLLPQFWHKGYATEAGTKVISYAFDMLDAKKLLAGHHPENNVSKHVLLKLGFRYICNELYPATGRMHLLYELNSK